MYWQPRGGFFRLLSSGSAVAAVVLGGLFAADPERMPFFWGATAAALVYGFLFAVAVGGADMPVVIALLNSCSGLAAAGDGLRLRPTTC